MAAPLYMRIGQILMKHRVFLLLSSIFASLSAYGQSADTQPETWQQQIHFSITSEMEKQLQVLTAHMDPDTIETEVKIAHLDPRLKLSHCQNPLSVLPARNIKIGRQHVKVECQGSKSWAINLPVDLNVYAPVVVLNQPIAKGTKLSTGHLTFKQHNLANLRSGYFLKKESLIGKQSKRALAAQSILNDHLVLPALMIYKGDRVMIVAKKAGMSVKMPGEALNNGREGRQIRVKNARSQRVIKGKVVAPGLVEVNF